MYYEYHVTTPANTTEASPLRTELRIDFGTVHQVEMQFPRGCSGLLHARVFNELHQIWPANDGGDIASENARIAWSEDYDVSNAAKRLILVTWNEDDSYDHTLYLRIALTEEAKEHQRRRGIAALSYLADWYDAQPQAGEG